MSLPLEDGPPPASDGGGEPAAGLWLSVSDIARARGVEKSSVSRRVARLEAAGFTDVRNGAGGKKLINLAAFDRATGEMTDEVREANGRQRVGAGKKGGLAAEQMRKTAYQADLAQLDLAERQGKLLPVENVNAAAVRVGETIVRLLNRLPSHADDVAAAVAKDGAQGARVLLKSIVHDALELAARELRALSAIPEGAEIAAWPKAPESFEAIEADSRTRFAELLMEGVP